ncbi:MAG: YciI family protein [Bacteroidota bacterium]
MKDFMLIFIGPDYAELGLSPEEIQGRMGKWFAWHEKMEKDGVVIKGGHALQPHGKTITGNDRTVSDGLYTESKEIVGGYYVVQAKDYDEAVTIAHGFPDFDLQGTVEVREIMVFEE